MSYCQPMVCGVLNRAGRARLGAFRAEQATPQVDVGLLAIHCNRVSGTNLCAFAATIFTLRQIQRGHPAKPVRENWQLQRISRGAVPLSEAFADDVDHASPVNGRHAGVPYPPASRGLYG